MSRDILIRRYKVTLEHQASKRVDGYMEATLEKIVKWEGNAYYIYRSDEDEIKRKFRELTEDELAERYRILDVEDAKITESTQDTQDTRDSTTLNKRYRPHKSLPRPTIDSNIKASRATIPIAKRPPAKRPPSLFAKVRQYWNVTSGPTVSDEVYQYRLDQCTRYGGYTHAPIDGIVQKIEGQSILIDRELVVLPNDERATISVGDSVKRGQVISTGDVSKPCFYLVKSEKGIHCAACGCGARKKAELTQKLRYSRLVCPRIPPLFDKVEE